MKLRKLMRISDAALQNHSRPASLPRFSLARASTVNSSRGDNSLSTHNKSNTAGWESDLNYPRTCSRQQLGLSCHRPSVHQSHLTYSQQQSLQQHHRQRRNQRMTTLQTSLQT